jgi:hypothetical protein
MRGLTLTADLYQIAIDDRVVLTETLGVGGTGNTAAVQSAVTALLASSGFPQVAAARFFVNGLDTTTRGVDVVGTYRFNAGNLGTWSLTAAYNYNKTRIDRRLNELGPLAAIPGIVLFGRVEGSASPRASRATKSSSARTATSACSGSPPAPRATAGSSRRVRPIRSRTRSALPRSGRMTSSLERSGSRISSCGLAGMATARSSRSVRTICSTSIRIARPLAPADGRWAGLPGEPAIYSLLDLLALRLQRPLRLRPDERHFLIARARGGGISFPGDRPRGHRASQASDDGQSRASAYFPRKGQTPH